MDKTKFIRNELESMIDNNEIPKHLLQKVQELIRYLENNNIFEYERLDSREKYGDELIDILAVARQRYWDWKNEQIKNDGMDFDRIIRNYRMEIEDIKNGNELSEFETHYTLHTRSQLHNHYSSLTNEQKCELTKIDLLLIQNIGKVYNHLSKKYDFSQFNQPLEEWWWHIDKILDGTLRFEVTRNIKKSVGVPARASKGFLEVDLSIARGKKIDENLELEKRYGIIDEQVKKEIEYIEKCYKKKDDGDVK